MKKKKNPILVVAMNLISDEFHLKICVDLDTSISVGEVAVM